MRPFCASITCTLFLAGSLATSGPAAAQAIEMAGSRAPGMGGAFVALANDSSGTWWNPAALAAGPFLDLGIAHNRTAADGRLPAMRAGLTAVAIATPPFGVSYYRFQVTDIRALSSTGQPLADRQEGRAGTGVRSLSVTQVGATILHTLFTGIHVGTTVKYVRGTPRTSVVASGDETVSIPDLLDAADELEGGEAENTADLDVGALAVVGPVRVGGVVRNVTEPEFEGGMRLPRQVRIGGAYDWDAIGGPPLVIAVDADLRAYDPGGGQRRMVAVGAEQWVLPRRLGVRAGARFNTAGEKDEAITAGASVTVRAGVYVDGHVVYGGGAGEQGWGVAARVSF